jgi:hypothetical protein
MRIQRVTRALDGYLPRAALRRVVFFEPARRTARLTEEAARRNVRLAAFAGLFLRNFRVPVPVILRAARFVFVVSRFPSRSTECAMSLNTFGAAFAFAAMLPSVEPIDSATLINSASSLL